MPVSCRSSTHITPLRQCCWPTTTTACCGFAGRTPGSGPVRGSRLLRRRIRTALAERFDPDVCILDFRTDAPSKGNRVEVAANSGEWEGGRLFAPGRAHRRRRWRAEDLALRGIVTSDDLQPRHELFQDFAAFMTQKWSRSFWYSPERMAGCCRLCHRRFVR